jgi:hypothetical protein
MDFALAAEEKALLDALTQNLQKVCSPAMIRAWESEQVSFDGAFIQAIAQGGFLEAGLEFGDCPQFSVLVLLEETAGRFLAPPLLSWLSAYAAFLLGDYPLARDVAAGEVLAQFVPERASVTLRSGRVDGQASGVLFLDRARSILVVMDGAAAVVDAGQAVQSELVLMQSGVPQWNLSFHSAPAREIVLVDTHRRTQAMARLRASLAAWAAGAGAQAIDLACAYAKERVQFDHPIGSYQSVQNRLVDAAIQIEQARMLVSRAASLIDAGSDEAGDMAVLARHQAGKAFVQATRAAMLTFGGYAFTVDFDVQLFFRRAKEAQLAFEPRPSWQLAPGFRT